MSHFPIVYIVNITAGFLLLVYSSFVAFALDVFHWVRCSVMPCGLHVVISGILAGGILGSRNAFWFFAPTLGHLLWSFGVCVSDGLRRLQHISCCVNSHRASLSNFCVCFCLCVLFWLCCVLGFCVGFSFCFVCFSHMDCYMGYVKVRLLSFVASNATA